MDDETQKPSTEPTDDSPPTESGRMRFGNDNQAAPQPSLAADFVMGLRFFSRLPSGGREHETPVLNAMAPALPLVSTLIGLISALAILVTSWLGMPALLSACFGVAVHMLITGAMAEDGLADSVDGLWGGHSPAQRLEIMKDSRHGTYGVLALIMLVAIRLAVISALIVASLPAAALIWVGAQVVSRQGALWLPTRLVSARSDGTGHSVGELSKRAFGIGIAFAVPIFLVAAGGFAGWVGVLAALAITVAAIWGWTRLCHNLVGGYTGDLIGALQVLIEIGVLSTLVIFV